MLPVVRWSRMMRTEAFAQLRAVLIGMTPEERGYARRWVLRWVREDGEWQAVRGLPPATLNEATGAEDPERDEPE